MKDPKFIDLTEGQKYKLPTNIEHCVGLNFHDNFQIFLN